MFRWAPKWCAQAAAASNGAPETLECKSCGTSGSCERACGAEGGVKGAPGEWGAAKGALAASGERQSGERRAVGLMR